MHHLRLLRMGTVASIALLTLAACGSSSTANSNGTPIVIGYEAPLTGASAGPGNAEVDGWNLGLKTFGSKVDGHPIKSVIVDTQGDPTVALADAKTMVTVDNIDLLEGPLLASEDAPVASYIEPTGIPTDDLSLCSEAQVVAYNTYHAGYSSGWACSQPATVAAEYLYNDKGIRDITVAGSDYAFAWISLGAFAAEFEHLGGKIDKAIWAPLSTTDFSSYVLQIPPTTQAVFTTFVGAANDLFVNAYDSFGLKAKIPLYGNTTLTDYSVLPAEHPAAALGIQIIAQYCDGIQNPVNQKFNADFFKAYGAYGSYYSEAGYTKARLAISALAKLHGVATNHKAVIKALLSTPIVAARGPVKMNTSVYAPIQNIYVCQVENVNGHLSNVPIKTYKNVEPWGPMAEAQWSSLLATDSAGRPSL